MTRKPILELATQVMLKLYKRSESETLYWEAWDAGNGEVTVHWGRLGETGRNQRIQIPQGETAETTIDCKSQDPRANAYEEIDIDDHAQIIVQFKTEDEWGDTSDLDKRYSIEDILNECLGWTGNGHCDGGDIGSGTINAFCFVVDPNVAKNTIVGALKENGLLDGAVIALDTEDDYEVVWPEGFDGTFSLL